MQRSARSAAPKPPTRPALVWRLAGVLAALVCLGGAGAWLAGVENAGPVTCTLLAGLVLAVSLVLAVGTKPRRR